MRCEDFMSMVSIFPIVCCGVSRKEWNKKMMPFHVNLILRKLTYKEEKKRGENKLLFYASCSNTPLD